MQNSAIAVQRPRRSTSTTPSATSGRSPPTRPTILRILAQPGRARCRAWSATPARSSRRSAPATRSWPARSSTPTPTFEALASRDAALAETIQIFPTFNEETRLTLNRLAEFAGDTQPLVNDLQPVADDLSPTFEAVQRLSPNLKRLFINLDPLLDASRDRAAGAAQGRSASCARCWRRSIRSSPT